MRAQKRSFIDGGRGAIISHKEIILECQPITQIEMNSVPTIL